MQYILYHQVKPGVDCPDGIAAAWVAAKAYPDAQIIGVSYQEDPPITPESGDIVIIVDFSYPADVINGWRDRGVQTILIDHHKTAQQMLQGLPVSPLIRQHFDMDECGATLAWKTFFPAEPMPAFLQYVRSRDLWLDCDLFAYPIPDTLIVHEAMSGLRWVMKKHAQDLSAHSHKYIFAAFDDLAELGQSALLTWADRCASSKLKAKREKCLAIASLHEWKTLNAPDVEKELLDCDDWSGDYSYNIPVVELTKDGTEDRYTSDVCMVLYRKFPNAPFVACITSDGSWSLRSDRDGTNADVGAIAKALGGGGHRNAAGFHPDK